MTDKPILMSAPMVLAILREVACPGTGKTMTRRILKPQPPRGDHYGKDIMDWSLSGIYQDERNSGPSKWWLDVQTDVDDNSHREIDVRFAVGQRLWVREAWAPLSALTHNDPGAAALATNGFYRADDSVTDGEIKHWRPSIHMPRWASRLTLAVTDVKIERLQSISEADARAEGVLYVPGHGDITYEELRGDPGFSNYLHCRMGFEVLWETLHGRGSWLKNPWVVAVSFRPELRNIDAPALPPQSPLLLREAGER